MWRQLIELLLKNVARIAYNHLAEKKFAVLRISDKYSLKTAKEKANVIIIKSGHHM